jgi:hypothetical protein
LGDVEVIMRTILGMILGCLLTITAAYIRDSTVTSTAPNGTSTSTSDTIVNWNVAARDWGHIKETAHTAWLKLQSINSQPSKSGDA